MQHVFVSLSWLLTELCGSCFPQSSKAKSYLGHCAIFHLHHGGAGGRQRSTDNRKTDGQREKDKQKHLQIRHGKVPPVIVGVYYLARGNCTLCHPQALNGNYQVKLTKWDVVTKPPFRDEGWQWAGDGWGLKLVLREWVGQCHRWELLKGVQWRPVSGLPVWQMDLLLWSWRVQEPHWLTKTTDGDTYVSVPMCANFARESDFWQRIAASNIELCLMHHCVITFIWVKALRLWRTNQNIVLHKTEQDTKSQISLFLQMQGFSN